MGQKAFVGVVSLESNIAVLHRLSHLEIGSPFEVFVTHGIHALRSKLVRLNAPPLLPSPRIETGISIALELHVSNRLLNNFTVCRTNRQLNLDFS